MTTESEINELRRHLDGDEKNILERVLAGFHKATEALNQIERAADDVSAALKILEPEWTPTAAEVTYEAKLARYQTDINTQLQNMWAIEVRLRDSYTQYYQTVRRYEQVCNDAQRFQSVALRMQAGQLSNQLATMKQEQEGYKARINTINQYITRLDNERKFFIAGNPVPPRTQVERSILTAFQGISSTTVQEVPKVDNSIKAMEAELTLLSVFRVRLSIQGIDPIALIAPLFNWDFMPVSFEGEVSADKDSFKGKATLKAPLSLTLDPLTAQLKPGSIVVKFGIPETAGFAQTFESKAATTLGPFWPLAKGQTQLVADLLRKPTIILSNKEGRDPQFGTYLGGFNVFAPVDITHVAGVVDLLAFVSGLGINLPSVNAIAGFGIDSSRRMLSVKLPLNLSMMSSAFVLDSLYFAMIADTASTNTSVRCGIEFTVKLDGLTMPFVGAFEKNTTSVSVWGAWDGTWRDPFGVKGIELRDIGAEISTNSTYPAVRGGASLYGVDIHGDFGIKLDEKSPVNSIVVVAFNRSMSVFDLAQAFVGYSGPKPTFIEMQDVKIHIAPKGGTIAGKYYPPGMNAAGTASLFGLFTGSIDLSLSLKLGLLANLKLQPWSLSIGGFDFIKLGAIDVSFSLPPFGFPSFGFNVSLSLFNGLLTLPNVRFNLEDLKLVMPKIPGSGSFMVDVGVVIDSEKVEIGFAPKFSLSVDVFGTNIGVSVASKVVTAIEFPSTVSTQLEGSIEVLGTTLKIGPITVQGSVTTLTDLTSLVKNHVLDSLKTLIKDLLVKDPRKVLEWAAKTVGTLATQGLAFVANFAKQSGAALTQALHSGAQAVFGQSMEQVSSVFRSVGFDAKAVTSATEWLLRNALLAPSNFEHFKLGAFFGGNVFLFRGQLVWSEHELQQVLLVQELSRQLQASGFPIVEWAPALSGLAPTGNIALGLKGVATVAQIGDLLVKGMSLDANAVANAMRGAGFAITEVSGVLTQNFNLGSQAMATTFKAAGYGVSTVGNFMRDNLGMPGAAVASVLNVAGYGIEEVGGYMEDVLGYTGDALETVLKGAGYAVSEVAGFFEDVAETLNPSNW